MGDRINTSGTEATPRPVPELPPRLTGLFPLVVAGTILWLLGFAGLAIYSTVTGTPPGVWLWTTVAGAGLGFVGMGIMTWQRSAARRGSRGAQTGL
ncbi:DUF2530 domain-containing protein [Amycolatopsis pigmentata]|uniref:DUF2530 domain-containing protein n=1 Tax=Amycolatopsis pigmentata TaxID=450801 RepID=A0ABW5FRZ6_9PSEU